MNLPMYRFLDSALYAAFGQPQAQYSQLQLGGSPGVITRQPDGMSRLDWLAQHGLVRQALERELQRDQCLILLLSYGSDELRAQRLGARLRMAELLQAEMPSAQRQFLFSHVVASWCEAQPRGELREWADKLEISYKTLAKQRVRGKCLLNAWLDDARARAGWVIAQRGWLADETVEAIG